LDFGDVNFGFLVSAAVRSTRHGRLFAVGRPNADNIVAVVFAPLGTEALAIISMRPANKKERLYAP